MKQNKLISHDRVETEKLLYDWFTSNLLSDDGIFIKRIEGQNCRVTIFIAEDYSFRISSTLTLTVIVEESTNGTAVEIISSGGKGAWGFSYGVEKNAVKRIVKMLKENGFREQ